jgi:small subunit ribosomal protein S1
MSELQNPKPDNPAEESPQSQEETPTGGTTEPAPKTETEETPALSGNGSSTDEGETPEAQPSAAPAATATQEDPDLDDDELTSEQREEMLQMYEESLRSLGEGEIVKGRILSMDDNEVTVDIGGKSEGVIPLQEFRNGEEIEVGEEVEV